MSKSNPKAAKAAKASKLVPPVPLTDAEFEKAYRVAHGIPKEAKSEVKKWRKTFGLEEAERECRRLLASTLRDAEDLVALPMPVSADLMDNLIHADNLLAMVRDIRSDANDWRNALLALNRAALKGGKEAA